MSPSSISAILESGSRQQLLETYNLSAEDLDRLLNDLIGMTNQIPEAWIRSRHSQLQTIGWKNDQIFEQIRLELPHRRFASPDYSPRQLRRFIYG